MYWGHLKSASDLGYYSSTTISNLDIIRLFGLSIIERSCFQCQAPVPGLYPTYRLLSSTCDDVLTQLEFFIYYPVARDYDINKKGNMFSHSADLQNRWISISPSFIGEVIRRQSAEHKMNYYRAEWTWKCEEPMLCLNPFLARSLPLQSVHPTAAMASSVG